MSPRDQLLDEITEEDLQVSTLVVDAMQGYEHLGYDGIAADSIEFVKAYEGYRASQREKLRWLISLQYEFVPQASTEERGILRPVIKGTIIAAAAKAVFG